MPTADIVAEGVPPRDRVRPRTVPHLGRAGVTVMAATLIVRQSTAPPPAA
jgi:hypothetical protein